MLDIYLFIKNFKHVIYADETSPAESDIDEDSESDWENSVATSDLNTTDESDDEREIQVTILTYLLRIFKHFCFRFSGYISHDT